MKDHFRFTPWGRVSGWKDGVACDLMDATSCTFEVGFGLHIQKFDMPAPSDYETRRLEYALDTAFKCGDTAARAEIRKVLGVKEPRQ